MTDAQLQSLLDALPGDAPCGADLQFDADFLLLEEAAAGEPEREYGQTLIPAKGPNWRVVHEQAMKLAERSRDLRLAAWLTRSGARLGGLADAVRGLQLVQGLLVRHWEPVHPQDETARLNAISPLLRADAGLADLRAASLGSRRGAITVREIELTASPALAHKGEPLPTAEGVAQGVAAASQALPELPALMRAGREAVQGIDTALRGHLDAGNSLDMTPLAKLMDCIAKAAADPAAEGEAVGDAAAPSPAAAAVSAAPGEISSREDAIRGLERICDWIERNEPASPAPLFIRRSQQLLQKSFIDIIRDLLPDNVKQIEHFAGKATTNGS